MFDRALLDRRMSGRPQRVPAQVELPLAPLRGVVAEARAWHQARVAEGAERIESPATEELRSALDRVG